MVKPKVILTRYGSPDKANRFISGNYDLIGRDQANLRDFSVDELTKFLSNKDHWFLTADEEDIAFANKLPLNLQKQIILPQGKSGIVSYDNVVPKNGEFYDTLKNFGIIYPAYEYYDNIEDIKEATQGRDRFALKVTNSSGSRGIYIVNSGKTPDRGAREQYQSLTEDDYHDCDYWMKRMHCGAIIQKLSYDYAKDMSFFGINMIIRHGKLILSKWEIGDNPSTNFDHGIQRRTEFTDMVTKRFFDAFISYGITDGILGIDGCTNYKDDIITLNEVNFRMENCVFSFETMGIDAIDAYIFPENYSMDMIPYGDHPFIRYWRAKFFDPKDYQGGLPNE